MYNPPEGYLDFLDDVSRSVREYGPYVVHEIPGIGPLRVRRPIPKSLAALGKAVGAKISDAERNSYIGLFVQNHVEPDDFTRLLAGMMMGDYPSDSVALVCKSISTWGTARPTVPSSTSRC